MGGALSCEGPTFVPAYDGLTPCDTAAADIVFVHGLTGDRYESWADGPETFWPGWLAQQFPTCNIYTAGYDTELFYKALTGPGASIQDLGAILADSLVSRPCAAPVLILVTHSLGGLVVKQMIRKCCDSADSSFNEIARSVRGIAFLGTPHQGAQLAQALDIILKNHKSQAVKALAYGSDALIDLHEFFRAWATKNGVLVKPYYETQHTWGVHVVDKVTANPNVYGADPVAVQANHIGICKPTSRQATVYQSIAKLIEILVKAPVAVIGPADAADVLVITGPELPADADALPSAPSSLIAVPSEAPLPALVGADDAAVLALDGVATDILADYQFYTTAAEDDRRDLAQKLIDVGRSYQVKGAERKKERFNMTLRRNIAQPAAVTRYTRLMADVETRFNRHVARLIAAGAPPEAVDEAIQREIVNPCATTHSVAGSEISASLVDSALYYLAGNCHIRWDDGAA